MSELIKDEPKIKGMNSKDVFKNIREVITSQFKTTEQYDGNHMFQVTVPTLVFGKVNKYRWRFQEVVSTGGFKVTVKPLFKENPDQNFKIQPHTGNADIFKIVNQCNDCTGSLIRAKFFVSQFNQLQIQKSFERDVAQNIKRLETQIKIIFKTIVKKMKQLKQSLNPIFNQVKNRASHEPVSQAVKNYINKHSKTILLTEFRRIQEEEKRLNQKQGSQEYRSNRDICLLINKKRKQNLQKMKACLRLLGYSQIFLSKQASEIIQTFDKWRIKNNQEKPKMACSTKNVNGVKLIQKTKSEIKNNVQGKHSKIMLERYKLLLMISVNKETNNAFENNSENGKIRMEQVAREMNLIVKQVKDTKNILSKNSLQNELQFIFYIKDRQCQYISTYYLDQDKTKAVMQTIMMEQYHQSLKEMLQKEGGCLSLRQHLIIFRQIVQGVDWLSRNYVCHRDLKPANIMLDINRTPKIIDFGSCCPVYGENGHFSLEHKELLGSKEFYHKFKEGSFNPMTKEQYQQHERFDVYSLGQIMNHMFKGRIINLLPNLQLMMCHMIEKCKTAHPNNRFTYQELLISLDNMIQYFDWLHKIDD